MAERHRLTNAEMLIALYATVVFLTLFLVPTVIDPQVHKEAQLAGKPSPFLWLGQGEPLQYPLGAWVAVFSPLAGVICFAAGRFAARHGPKADFTATLATFGGLFVFALLFTANFHFSVPYAVAATLLSGVLAIIQGLHHHSFDFAYTTESCIPIACRMERLKSTYEKWARTLNWFLGVATAIMVTSIIALSKDSSERFGQRAAELVQGGMIAYALVALPGVAFGIVWPMFSKLTELAHSFTKITKDT